MHTYKYTYYMTDQIVTFKTPFIILTFFSLLDIKIYNNT